MTSNSNELLTAPLPNFRKGLVLLLLGTAILPLIVLAVGAGALLNSVSQRQAAERLTTTASYRQTQLEHWIDNLSVALYRLAAANPTLPDALQTRSIDDSVMQDIRQSFSGALNGDGLSELILVSADDRILYSTNPERTLAPPRNCPARIICTFEFLQEGNRTRLIVQYPLIGEQTQQVGALIGLADTTTLDTVLGSRVGLESSGAAYLVGPDGVVRWLPGIGPLTQKRVAFPALQRGLLPSEPMTYPGLLGSSTLGIATSILRLNAWLIVEQALDEINQPISVLPPLALALIALTLAGIILGSRVLDRQVSRPLAALTARSEQLDAALDTARAADQVKSRAIASMSHELRTPINSILNFSGFLMDNLFGSLTPDQTELVRQMHYSSQHLLDLINDLIDMSKIEAGQMRLFVTEFDPMPVFEQTVATLRSLTLSKPITIQTDFPRAWPTVRGDRRRVLQILLNLVSNAAKFTNEGTIMLRVHLYATRLEVRIEDSGMGVPAEDVPLLFEPFRQGHNALILEKGGSGLGLPLSRIFARMHGGDVDYEPGERGGAVFIFWMPLDVIDYEQKSK